MNKGFSVWAVIVIGICGTACTVQATSGGGDQPAKSSSSTQPNGGDATSEQIRAKAGETCTSICEKIKDNLACQNLTPESCLSECNASISGPCASEMLAATACFANGELTCKDGKLAPKDLSLCMTELEAATQCMASGAGSSSSGGGGSTCHTDATEDRSCSSDSDCCKGFHCSVTTTVKPSGNTYSYQCWRD